MRHDFVEDSESGDYQFFYYLIGKEDIAREDWCHLYRVRETLAPNIIRQSNRHPSYFYVAYKR